MVDSNTLSQLLRTGALATLLLGGCRSSNAPASADSTADGETPVVLPSTHPDATPARVEVPPTELERSARALSEELQAQTLRDEQPAPEISAFEAQPKRLRKPRADGRKGSARGRGGSRKTLAPLRESFEPSISGHVGFFPMGQATPAQYQLETSNHGLPIASPCDEPPIEHIWIWVLRKQPEWNQTPDPSQACHSKSNPAIDGCETIVTKFSHPENARVEAGETVWLYALTRHTDAAGKPYVWRHRSVALDDPSDRRPRRVFAADADPHEMERAPKFDYKLP